MTRGAARLTLRSHAARGNEGDMIRDIHYAKYLEIVLCVTFSSFLRAAWECSPGALRPEARRI